jgi:hypothetical protein
MRRRDLEETIFSTDVMLPTGGGKWTMSLEGGLGESIRRDVHSEVFIEA